MFLKKEVILLGVLLSLRIIFTIVQILIDYKILSGQYSVNFMDISEVFTYQLSDDELVGTKGGFGLAEAVGIAGVLNAAVQIFNAGYKFGSDFARRGR